jgi:hypothetical protein
MKLTYLDAADAEFREAIDYYNEQREGPGFGFADEVTEAVSRIRNILTLDSAIKTNVPLLSSPISLQHHLRSANRYNYYRRDSTSSDANQIAPANRGAVGGYKWRRYRP